MKNTKYINSQIFNRILSVNKQKEDEFNNGQDGAIILSLLVMFFVPFLLLNAARQWLQIDYSLVSVAGMLFISGIFTCTLYKMFNIGQRFSDKQASLNELLSCYVPNNKIEFENFKVEFKSKQHNFFDLVDEWVKVEQMTFAK